MGGTSLSPRRVLRAQVAGTQGAASWTPRGGEHVSALFASLVDLAAPETKARKNAKTLSDPCNQHKAHLAAKRLCFARSLETAPDDMVGRVPLPDGADVAVSEECYLATELLFARKDECPVPSVANAPPLQSTACDAIRMVKDKTKWRALFNNVIFTGFDDSNFPGAHLRLAQELVQFMRGRVHVRALGQ